VRGAEREIIALYGAFFSWGKDGPRQFKVNFAMFAQSLLRQCPKPVPPEFLHHFADGVAGPGSAAGDTQLNLKRRLYARTRATDPGPV